MYAQRAYRKEKKKPSDDFLMVIMVSSIARGARTHDGDDNDGDDNGGVAQDVGDTLNNGLTETWSLGLPCTFLIYDVMLWSIDTCQIKLPAD